MSLCHTLNVSTNYISEQFPQFLLQGILFFRSFKNLECDVSVTYRCAFFVPSTSMCRTHNTRGPGLRAETRSTALPSYLSISLERIQHDLNLSESYSTVNLSSFPHIRIRKQITLPYRSSVGP